MREILCGILKRRHCASLASEERQVAVSASEVSKVAGDAVEELWRRQEMPNFSLRMAFLFFGLSGER